MNKKDYALSLHKKGFNCAQSVACAFSDELGYDTDIVFQLSEAFGGGMGTFSTCGAVSGMALVIGMKESDGNLSEPATKRICYKLMAKATEKFEESVSSTICREIKGIDTGNVLKSCDGCIAHAVEILEEILN